MSITIGLTKLEVEAIIGALEEERAKKQKLWIDLSITYDAKKAIISDDVLYVVDYRDLEKECRLIASQEFYLLESFAETLAETFISKYPIFSIELTVAKKAYGIKADKSFVSVKKTALASLS